MPRGMGRGRGAVEKPKDFGGVMKKLVKFCSRYIPVMILALVLGAAGTVCQIIGPDKLKDMTNEITKGLPAMVHGKPVMNSIDMDAVSRIAWLLVALYVGYALLSYLQSWLMANVTQRTAQQLREAISKKINRLPLKYFDKISYGDVLSRITNDVDAIGQTLGQSVGSLITSITLFVGALVMMFYNNVIMTLCAIGSALLGLIIMGVIMKVSQKYFTRQQVALGDVNGHVEEMYTGHTVVKAYCGEERSIEQFEKYNNDLYVSGWKSQFLSGLMMPLMNFVGNFGYVVVCVVGAALALDGQIEFGVIVAFMMYIRLFTQPLSQFAQAFQNLQRCAAASERVFGFLEEPELSDETGKQALLGVGADGKPQPVRGDVEFSHVRFGYDADKTIINDFSASVKAGQKVAIVGPTGAGKTTMVNLLMRFYEISGGTISIDGIDTKSVPRWNVHDQFSMVLQDTWVFRGTVRENIAYSKKDVTDEEYNNFYKEKFFDFEDPLAVIHANVEGAVTYKALLYIPAKAPYDFYTKDYEKGLALYASGVLIMEKCADLLPDYFSFVKGIVDSQDLSLNISREMLQKDNQLKLIHNALEKKIKNELHAMLANDRTKYEEFWKEFGRQIKFGAYSDYGMHAELLRDLLLFWSAKEQKMVTLQEYVDKMPAEQKYIYFAAGDSTDRLAKLPAAELVMDKGYDVLLLTEDVDEFCLQILRTYPRKDAEGKDGTVEFKNVNSGDLGLETEDEKKAAEEANTANLDAAVAAIEAVNPIANPRALDDFSVENELMLTMDNLVAYKGDVTNDQADCGLVFVAQAKDGQVDAVKSELEAYKASLSANDLYAEFADKIALAKDARIVTNGNYVAIVIAGIANPDYAAIDTALETALNF